MWDARRDDCYEIAIALKIPTRHQFVFDKRSCANPIRKVEFKFLAIHCFLGISVIYYDGHKVSRGDRPVMNTAWV